LENRGSSITSKLKGTFQMMAEPKPDDDEEEDEIADIDK
jgi:hypothetical protein